MKIEFQHLDTQSPKKSITLFGRTLDDKSVAVHIDDFNPKLYIVVDRNPDSLRTLINASLIRYRESRNIFDFDPDTIKNINLCISDYARTCLWFRIVRGQDITDYNEHEALNFLEITALDKYVFNDLKAILTRKCEFISSQINLETDAPMTDRSCKKHEVKFLTNKKYMIDKPYTIYNDQVDYGLQYLISKDIYSCSWMEVTGVEVREKKQTTCDIELLVTSLKQIERNDVAPWHILTYDIESVPHPRGNGKFDFPKAEIDPVCTI